MSASTDPSSEPDQRLAAVRAVARHHGVDLAAEYRPQPGEPVPSPAALAAWAHEHGLRAKPARIAWSGLRSLGERAAKTGPAVILLRDGGALLLIGANAEKDVVILREPGGEPLAMDRLRLERAWGGEILLVRRGEAASDDEARFSLGWLLKLVLHERPMLRDVAASSVTLSALTIIPPLLVMQVVDRVVVHHSINTLVLLAVILVITSLYEMLLGYSRRSIIQVISTRVDAKINMHVFTRLLALPLDYFERNSAGQVNYKIMQTFKVREFLTGKLLGTALDLVRLLILLPFMFWIDATLAWMVLGCSALIALVIWAFLPALRRVVSKLTVAESLKGSIMVETVHGIRTVKSLGLEPQRTAEWDERAAAAGALKLRAGQISNWPQTLINPIEGFIQRGVLLVGAYLALMDDSGIAIGGLLAFMMLGGRVAQPLVGLARLIEDIEDVRCSIEQVGSVLNNPTETAAMTRGMRPDFEGRISLEDLSFTYPGTRTPALDRVSFDIPAGTMLGVVGRSGSGKSTLTRLLQGMSRDYTGFLKIDGNETREINLAHLRRSFGVVLQDNFLFRGTVRDNIAAGRPGLRLEEVVRAARLAGAEEFIERLPAGYDTCIEEGSANLSGGQKQRLAIARAVVADPRILILDEATSALDPESEAAVNANLTRLGKGRTMVIVSHRLSSLVECDLIMVMDRGRVVDVAPHLTLLDRCPIYAALWAQQNRHLAASRPPALVTVAGRGA